MAVSKPTVAWVPAHANNFKVGRSLPISRITFHHIVGDAPAAIARFKNGSQQVSATYVIGSDGKITQMVKDKDTPYTDGNFTSNSKAITIEHAGGHPNVAYTEKMYQSSIKLVAWLIQTYKIKDFKRHRDIIATACPGKLNVERIIRDAKIRLTASTAVFPKWVKVTAFPYCYVRSAPRRSAPLAGSRILPFGTPFRVVGVVAGESINGNNKWWKSERGNYVHTSVAR